MTDTQTITLPIQQVIASFRDGAIIVAICTIGWKARALYQVAKDFFKRSLEHMDKVEKGMNAMESGMSILLDNHLTHIQADLKSMSGRKEE